MQTSLFLKPGNIDQCQLHALGDAEIHEFPQAFPESEASTLLSGLLRDIPWRQEALHIAGKRINVPRLQCWMGDRSSLYGYSGMRLLPIPWHTTVLTIRQRVQALAGIEFNSVLLNYYRDGKDSVAWHADNEPELGTDPIIASVSFGAERYFQLKPKQRGTANNYRLLLRHGSVLVMGKGLQSKWLHQLPKVEGLDQPRINLTFRQIL